MTTPPEQKPMTVTNNTLIFNYQGGDVTFRSEVHLHVSGPPRQPVEEPVVIRREVQAEPRPVDARCEGLRREHEERVRRWKAFPLRE